MKQEWSNIPQNLYDNCFIFHNSIVMQFRLLNGTMMKYNNIKSLLWDMIKGFESFSCVCYCKKLVFMTIYLDISLVSLCNVLPLFIILNIATCNSILLSFFSLIVLTFNIALKNKSYSAFNSHSRFNILQISYQFTEVLLCKLS